MSLKTPPDGRKVKDKVKGDEPNKETKEELKREEEALVARTQPEQKKRQVGVRQPDAKDLMWKLKVMHCSRQ